MSTIWFNRRNQPRPADALHILRTTCTNSLLSPTPASLCKLLLRSLILVMKITSWPGILSISAHHSPSAGKERRFHQINHYNGVYPFIDDVTVKWQGAKKRCALEMNPQRRDTMNTTLKQCAVLNYRPSILCFALSITYYYCQVYLIWQANYGRRRNRRRSLAWRMVMMSSCGGANACGGNIQTLKDIFFIRFLNRKQCLGEDSAFSVIGVHSLTPLQFDCSHGN